MYKLRIMISNSVYWEMITQNFYLYFFLQASLLSYSSYIVSSLHEALKQNVKHMGFLFLYQHVQFIIVHLIWDTYSIP